MRASPTSSIMSALDTLSDRKFSRALAPAYETGGVSDVVDHLCVQLWRQHEDGK